MLTGRAAEVAAVRAAIDDGGVLVRGHAGIGKTTTLTEALDGRVVRTIQCFRSMSRIPGAALRRAWPQPIPDGDAAWVSQWIGRATRRERAVLRVEDVQWADAYLLEVLRALPAGARVAATMRDGDPGCEDAELVAAERGLTTVVVGPLADDAGVEVVRRHHPHLRAAEAREIVRRCAGNPLMMTQLGSRDAADAGLQRTFVARLRSLGADAWEGFAAIALAEMPLPAGWVPGADTLRAAGAVVQVTSVDGGTRLAAPHRLLAEAVVEELAAGGEAAPRTVFASLAGRATAAGHDALAARWTARGGDRERAAVLAEAAARASTRPGERADLLGLAASSSDGADRERLAAEAVGVLVAAGEYAQAARLVDLAPNSASAHWAGLVGRVLWQQGDAEGSRAAYETGLARAEPGSRDEVLLKAELARVVTLAHGDAETGIRLAREAVAASRAIGAEQARALAVLGTAENFVGSAEDAGHLQEAVDLAAAAGDVMVEFTSANNLVAVHESSGRPRLAAELAAGFAARADELHLRSWYQQMSAMELNARMHLGDYDTVLVRVPELLAEGLDRRTREQLEVTLALTSGDLGRAGAAARVQRVLDDPTVDDWTRGNLLYVLGECRLWAGAAEEALAAATQAIDVMPANGIELLAALTAAHACRESGRPVGRTEWPDPYAPILRPATIELDALAAASEGDRPGAAALFDGAAEAWAGQHLRGELRCRWLAADHAADADRAIAVLVELSGRLEALGWQPLLERVRRSLRDRGVRSSAPRGRAGQLTAREREVLDLVGQGLATQEIAARLQLAPSTVTALIASARGRLGAASRWQAASGA